MTTIWMQGKLRGTCGLKKPVDLGPPTGQPPGQLVGAAGRGTRRPSEEAASQDLASQVAGVVQRLQRQAAAQRDCAYGSSSSASMSSDQQYAARLCLQGCSIAHPGKSMFPSSCRSCSCATTRSKLQQGLHILCIQ